MRNGVTVVDSILKLNPGNNSRRDSATVIWIMALTIEITVTMEDTTGTTVTVPMTCMVIGTTSSRICNREEGSVLFRLNNLLEIFKLRRGVAPRGATTVSPWLSKKLFNARKGIPTDSRKTSMSEIRDSS